MCRQVLGTRSSSRAIGLTPTGSGDRARNLNIARALVTAGTCRFAVDPACSLVMPTSPNY
ncbi:hypothetical protein GCM10011319_42900 [Mameliella alba]|nr:hypothetical protein GCM10011319_42900 [Mameliella alba]